jgi:hypothetical protein
MKTARFIFVMVIGVVLQGTSVAGKASPVSQEVPSQSAEKSPSDQPKDGEVRGEKEPTRSSRADELPKPHARMPKTAKRRTPVSYSKPASNHQPRPANTSTSNRLRTTAPASTSRLPQTASKVVPIKALNHHSAPAPQPGASVNGRQFRNSRDTGARFASSGGPLTAARGTAAINGTDIKRKP